MTAAGAAVRACTHTARHVSTGTEGAQNEVPHVYQHKRITAAGAAVHLHTLPAT